MEDKKNLSLPENAHRPLEKGEKYNPILPADKKFPEVTVYSVLMGLLMVIIFSAAAAYLGLKVGQVFEAAIPIAILAVGITGALGKKDGLGQNVIIQSIGACSGVIVAGAIFTLPAIYILGLDVSFGQMFLSSLLGGILGILFLIPYRKYFVKEMHGQYPFPEATATTQVLVSGESGGKSAKTLLVAGLIGGLYDFIVATFGAWSETVTTTVMHWGKVVSDKAKVVLKLNTGAAVLGLGYIVGLKYAFVICCGSFLVWLVIIPLMNLIWGGQVIDLMGTGIAQTISQMSPDQIFKEYARHIGIGGIATAGIIGIIKSAGVIKSAVGLAAGEFKKRPGAKAEVTERTDRRGGQQHLAGPYRPSDRCSHLLPVHYGSRQRNCYCGNQPRERNDHYDPYHHRPGACGSRSQGQCRNGCGNAHRRRCLHRPLNGRRLHH